MPQLSSQCVQPPNLLVLVVQAGIFSTYLRVCQVLPMDNIMSFEIPKKMIGWFRHKSNNLEISCSNTNYNTQREPVCSSLLRHIYWNFCLWIVAGANELVEVQELQSSQCHYNLWELRSILCICSIQQGQWKLLKFNPLRLRVWLISYLSASFAIWVAS